MEHLAECDPRSVSACEAARMGDAVRNGRERAGESSAHVKRAVVELSDVEDRVVRDRDICRIADAGQYIGKRLGDAFLSDRGALCPRERNRRSRTAQLLQRGVSGNAAPWTSFSP